MARIPDASKLGYPPRSEPAVPVETYDAEKWRQRADADAARKGYFDGLAFDQRVQQKIAAKRRKPSGRKR